MPQSVRRQRNASGFWPHSHAVFGSRGNAKKATVAATRRAATIGPTSPTRSPSNAPSAPNREPNAVLTTTMKHHVIGTRLSRRVIPRCCTRFMFGGAATKALVRSFPKKPQTETTTPSTENTPQRTSPTNDPPGRQRFSNTHSLGCTQITMGCSQASCPLRQGGLSAKNARPHLPSRPLAQGSLRCFPLGILIVADIMTPHACAWRRLCTLLTV